MFQSYYQLREQPFSVNPDPRFLYLSKTHREAFSSLLYRLQMDSGFMAMIAPPGMGKTTLLFHLLHRLRGAAKTAFIFQTQCTSNELLRNLLSEFECDIDTTDTVQMFRKLKSLLVTEANAGRRCVVIIDEAQNLGSEVLETIRLLSNFETPRRKLLNIVLSGQAELGDMLSSIGLMQLRQRMSCISYLHPFTPAETALYVAHRLEVAGFAGKVSDLFTIPSLVRVAHISQGVPRVINNLCFNALSLGFALESKQIDLSIIDEVAADLGIAPSHPSHPVQPGQAYSSELTEAAKPVQYHDHSETEREILSAVAARQEKIENQPRPPVLVPFVSIAASRDEQAREDVGANVTSPEASRSMAPTPGPDPSVAQAAESTQASNEPPLVATNAGKRHGIGAPFLIRSIASILVLCVAPVAGVQLSRTITARAAAQNPPSSLSTSGMVPVTIAGSASNEPAAGPSKATSYRAHPWNKKHTGHLFRKHHGRAPVDLTLATFTPEPLLKPLSLQPIVDAKAASQTPQARGRYIPPQPIWQPAPAYRPTRRSGSQMRDVQLMLSISSEGDVYRADVVKGGGALALAAKRAVKTWKYSPAVSNGVPVTSQVYVTIQFRRQ